MVNPKWVDVGEVGENEACDDRFCWLLGWFNRRADLFGESMACANSIPATIVKSLHLLGPNMVYPDYPNTDLHEKRICKLIQQTLCIFDIPTHASIYHIK